MRAVHVLLCFFLIYDIIDGISRQVSPRLRARAVLTAWLRARLYWETIANSLSRSFSLLISVDSRSNDYRVSPPHVRDAALHRLSPTL